MILKRAIWIAAVNYALSFIIGLIPMALIGADPSQMSDLPVGFFVIGVAISVILAICFTSVYFKDKHTKPSAKQGFYFGLVLLIVGFIFDIIIFILSFLASGSGMEIFSYYANPVFWLAALLVLVAATLVGSIKGKKRK